VSAPASQHGATCSVSRAGWSYQQTCLALYTKPYNMQAPQASQQHDVSAAVHVKAGILPYKHMMFVSTGGGWLTSGRGSIQVLGAAEGAAAEGAPAATRLCCGLLCVPNTTGVVLVTGGGDVCIV
jgi:hypothetical protein